MTSSFHTQTFPEYLKSLEQVELSEACEAVLSEFRSREAKKIKVEALRKLLHAKMGRVKESGRRESNPRV